MSTLDLHRYHSISVYLCEAEILAVAVITNLEQEMGVAVSNLDSKVSEAVQCPRGTHRLSGSNYGYLRMK